MKTPEAFAAIVNYTLSKGVTNLAAHPGLWESQVDEHWKIRVNGHSETVEGVPRYSAAIEYNGWPAGIIDPSGGIMTAGSEANEDTFIAAVVAATGKGND